MIETTAEKRKGGEGSNTRYADVFRAQTGREHGIMNEPTITCRD